MFENNLVNELEFLPFIFHRGIKVGYVPQTPWLLNGTLKQNIVFGLPYYEKHFLRVVQMCALKTDINSMPNKENTMVGDRGMTLSGGQKQRVMIARMLYSKADLLLMVRKLNSTNSFCPEINRGGQADKLRGAKMHVPHGKCLQY